MTSSQITSPQTWFDGLLLFGWGHLYLPCGISCACANPLGTSARTKCHNSWRALMHLVPVGHCLSKTKVRQITQFASINRRDIVIKHLHLDSFIFDCNPIYSKKGLAQARYVCIKQNNVIRSLNPSPLLFVRFFLNHNHVISCNFT